MSTTMTGERTNRARDILAIAQTGEKTEMAQSKLYSCEKRENKVTTDSYGHILSMLWHSKESVCYVFTLLNQDQHKTYTISVP